MNPVDALMFLAVMALMIFIGGIRAGFGIARAQEQADEVFGRRGDL